MSGSRPFVEGAQLQAERLASAALGFIGAQYAAGFAGALSGFFEFLMSPLVASRNAWAVVATGITRGPLEAVRTAYEPLQQTIANLGILGYVAGVAFVLTLGMIVVYGRDLLG